MRATCLLAIGLMTSLAGCGGGNTGGGDAAVDLAATTDGTSNGDATAPPDFQPGPDLLAGVKPEVLCGASTCKAPASACCRMSPFGAGTCVMPGGMCGEQLYTCDDPSDCATSQVCCYRSGVGSACTAPSECSAAMGQRLCLQMSDCTGTEMCCGTGPSPEYFCSAVCPISRRAYKKDIRYLDEADRRRLAAALLGFPLATYQYRHEGDGAPARLGFIIDDVAPSPAVAAGGEQVDLYAYTTMAVATIQEQAREIARLRAEVQSLSNQFHQIQKIQNLSARSASGRSRRVR